MFFASISPPVDAMILNNQYNISEIISPCETYNLLIPTYNSAVSTILTTWFWIEIENINKVNYTTNLPGYVFVPSGSSNVNFTIMVNCESEFGYVSGEFIIMENPDGVERKFIRGDINEDGFIKINDVIILLNYFFFDAKLLCLDAGDVNDDGEVSIQDIIILLNYLFSTSENLIIPQPFPVKDFDATNDNLKCIITQS